MRRSLSLSLYLLTTGRGDATAAQSAGHAPRPEGQAVWVAAGTDVAQGPLEQLCQALLAERPKLLIVLTCEGAAGRVMPVVPPNVIPEVAPADRPADVETFLAHWQPDALLLIGQSLPPATILACNARHVPVVLAGLGARADAFGEGLFRRQLAKSLLPRIDRILVADQAMALALHGLVGDLPAVEIAGHLEEVPQPLSCNEAERASLAQYFGTRGVWLAADCPEGEEEAVLAAHGQAMGMAHRMLLILVPQDVSQGAAVADRITREGYVVALRSHDEEPDAETQVYVADTDGEYGLWYRLAPVTYLGGTMWEKGPCRDPMEAAALGSAILCGPRTGDHAAAFAQLTAAKALRAVRSPMALADAVAELIAPDRAALLAHNAWGVSSGGAEVTGAVVQAVTAMLDRSKSVTGGGVR